MLLEPLVEVVSGWPMAWPVSVSKKLTFQQLIHCRERVRVSNVAVDVGAHTAKVVQELAQAMLGVLGGLRVDGGVAGGGRDRSGSGEAGGEVSMVGVGNQQVERAGARLPALADRLGELGLGQCLVGDNEIPSWCHRTSWLSQAPAALVTLSSPCSQPTGIGSESSPRNSRLVS